MNDQVELRIADVVGSGFCFAAADGQKVHNAIAAEFRSGRKVRLSFEGVEALTSAFLNVAVGQLYGEFSESQVKASLSFCGARPDDLYILKRVVDRAKEFFKDPGRFDAAVKEVLGGDDEF